MPAYINKNKSFPPDFIEGFFWSKVQVGEPDDCWEWLGGCHRGKTHGYPSYYYYAGEKLFHAAAHRVSFYWRHRRWPNEFLHHLCENPKCVNADHLKEVSHAENMSYERGKKIGPRKKLDSHIPPIPSRLRRSSDE